MLVGGGLALIGVLIALGSLLVVQRVGGNLLADVAWRRGAEAPAWLAVAILCGLGVALAAAGAAAIRIGWRAAAAADARAGREAR